MLRAKFERLRSLHVHCVISIFISSQRGPKARWHTPGDRSVGIVPTTPSSSFAKERLIEKSPFYPWNSIASKTLLGQWRSTRVFSSQLPGVKWEKFQPNIVTRRAKKTPQETAARLCRGRKSETHLMLRGSSQFHRRNLTFTDHTLQPSIGETQSRLFQ